MREDRQAMILRGRHFVTGDICDFHLADGRIRAITEPGISPAAIGDSDLWVCPGLLDLQVNGYAGHDFCSGETTREDVVAVTAKLASAGVTGFCPTVTTNSRAAITTSLSAIAAACEADRAVRDGVLGIHLEGPYISPEDGPRGAHPREHVRRPDWDEFTDFQDAASGLIRIVTIAPELDGASEFITRAARDGIVVAIGHHGASRQQINAAVNAGAVLATHLGNGCHAQLPRHPNYIWDQLAHDSLSASVIADGHHLPPAVVRSFFRIKGSSRLILVSDVVWVAGSPPGRYKFMGLDVDVREDLTVRSVGSPYLAGSSLKLADAIDHMMQFAGATFQEAIGMATENPARLLGLGGERGLLTLGARADLTLFRITGNRSKLAATIVGGRLAYKAEVDR